jgi:hypothetical protein
LVTDDACHSNTFIGTIEDTASQRVPKKFKSARWQENYSVIPVALKVDCWSNLLGDA